MAEYIHCPRCGSTDVEDPHRDIENDYGEVIEDVRCCNECGWEGSVDELEAE